MLLLTKIFHFEMAHAIHKYRGNCRHVHGHSYELHITVSAKSTPAEYLPAPGFIVDFKELKQIVSAAVISKLDHKLLLSSAYIDAHPAMRNNGNLLMTDFEPTAENLLLYSRSK